MLAQAPNNLHLLLWRQAGDGHFDDATDRGLVGSNEALVVHKGQRAHDELAVHAVGDAAVAWDRVAKVLDLEGSLDARRKKAAERRHQRRKSGENENVQLHGLDVDCARDVAPVWRHKRQRVSVLEEHRVRSTFEAGQEIRTKVVDWADKVLISHHQICQSEAKYNGKEPRADKALHGLFRRYLYQLSAAESNTADVCEDIIGDDEGDWQKEPDHALEDIVNDKMGLQHNKEKGEMGPGELGELEAVVSFLEEADKEYETWRIC